MNNQPEQRKPPQRRMIYGIAAASAIIFGTWLGVVIGFGPLGIIYTVGISRCFDQSLRARRSLRFKNCNRSGCRPTLTPTPFSV